MEFTVSDQHDEQEFEALKRVNAELTHSLERCRALLDDCRSKLAANSNEPELPDEDEESRLG